MINQARSHRKSEKTKDNKHYVPIPYIQGISEIIGKVLSNHNFSVACKSDNTLRSLSTFIKTTSDNTKKNCMHSTPRECGGKYIGETCRPLGSRISEHQKKVRIGDIRG